MAKGNDPSAHQQGRPRYKALCVNKNKCVKKACLLRTVAKEKRDVYQKFNGTRNALVDIFKFHLNPFGERSLGAIGDTSMAKFLLKACPLNIPRLQLGLRFSRRMKR